MKYILKILITVFKHYRAFKKYCSLNKDEKNISPIPEKLVADIIWLGPTFIKLGQILSTRPDVLPSQYISALEKLQENVPAFPFKEIKHIIENELKEPLYQKFHSFDEKPIASASISQVHIAVLNSGEKVAVKIQRPKIKEKILDDLQRLEAILNFIKFFFPKKVNRANLLNGFQEFKRYTIQELNFINEGEIIERFRKNFKDWDDVTFPGVYFDYSTEKILTMDWISGLRLKEAIQKLTNKDKEKLAIRLAEMELKMFISDGLFHADLHPGNIFFKEDGSIALLDFGMYGELTPEERNRFVLYWLAVVENDVKRAFFHFKEQCQKLPHANEKAFYEVFKDLADDFYKSRLIDVSITRVYLKMISAGYKYGYIFPEGLLLHAKALTTAEALTFKLFPDARFEKITKPIITREFIRLTLDGKQLKNRLLRTLPEFLLTGELVPTYFQSDSDVPLEFPVLWNDVFEQITQSLKEWQKNAGLFRSIFSHPAQQVLEEDMNSVSSKEILNNTWNEYARLNVDLPRQKTIGATFTIHLACVTVAIFKSLINSGKSKKEATELIYRIGWKIYTQMGEFPMLIAGFFSDNTLRKMELATQIFRMFPFTAPDYGWEDLKSEKGTVSFNCTRCYVAEYFKKFNLGDVCYNTWCKLDFPLAEQWGGKLVRTGSIAGCAEICDFRWIVDTENES